MTYKSFLVIVAMVALGCGSGDDPDVDGGTDADSGTGGTGGSDITFDPLTGKIGGEDWTPAKAYALPNFSSDGYTIYFVGDDQEDCAGLVMDSAFASISLSGTPSTGQVQQPGKLFNLTTSTGSSLGTSSFRMVFDAVETDTARVRVEVSSDENDTVAGSMTVSTCYNWDGQCSLSGKRYSAYSSADGPDCSGFDECLAGDMCIRDGVCSAVISASGSTPDCGVLDAIYDASSSANGPDCGGFDECLPGDRCVSETFRKCQVVLSATR